MAITLDSPNFMYGDGRNCIQMRESWKTIFSILSLRHDFIDTLV